MKLYVVRHGQTDWNTEGRIQGRTDIVLNQTGIEQANEVRNKIDELEIDFIISSPLTRTKQTAEIINKNKSVEIKFDDRLKERNFGAFEGLIRKQLDKYEDLFDYNLNKSIENGESIQDVFKRVHGFLEELNEKYEDKKILLVTHGGVSRAIDSYYTNNIEDDCILKNCEIKEY